jgi:hypothetical protein
MAIQLATPFSISGPGITAETDAYAAATKYNIDTVGQTIQVTFPLGTATTSGGKTTAFVPGLLANQTGSITIQFSLISNTWSGPNGQQGTLTSAQITAIQAIMAGVESAIRDSAESFALSVGVLAGTNVPW